MSLTEKPGLRGSLVDREKILRAVEELRKRLGVPFDATATAEQARASILADGVSPDDCLLSTEIIQAREE